MRPGVLLLTLLFLAPAPRLLAQTPLDAHWVWFDEGEPAAEAAAGTVWFRHELRASEPSTGEARLASSGPFVLWVNGQRVGQGEGGKAYRFNLNGIVERGPNIIAVQATHAGGPAGLLVDGEIRGQGGMSLPFDTGTPWLATRQEPEGKDWLATGFAAQGWTAVRDLGPHEDSPWKTIAFEGGDLDRYQLPPDFRIERIAEPELVGSLVAFTWGNRGRLIASPEGGPILNVIDDDGDGVYDRVVEFTNDVNNCQGLCQVGDDLYAVGNGPQGTGIYKLGDHDHDDLADGVELILAHRGGMGEHGPHSVVFGPDGWLYHNLGNHAWIPASPQAASPVHKPYEGDLLQPRFEDGNGHAAGIPVPGGSIWRFTPDGKQWWLETAGFRNEYDFAFNQLSELYTFDSDMEWDVGQPWYRPVRVNHCIPGAEFGWRSGTANWPEYYFDSLPSTVDIGRGSPTGMVFYEHNQFPERYRGSLLVCDWSMGRIIAVFLEPQGASFSGTWETLVSGNPLNVSDIEVDRDGSVVFSTGGRKTEGGLYRITYGIGQGERAPAPRVETLDDLVRLPQPQAAWAQEAARELQAKLGKEWATGLGRVARTGRPAEKLRALTLLAQLGPKPGPKFLVSLFADKDPSVRASAAWLASAHSRPEVGLALSKLLADADPRVQRRACEALVRGGLVPPADAVLPLLGAPDRWLRFAARLTLARVEPGKWREKVLASQQPRVVIEGLLTLMQAAPGMLSAADALGRVKELLESGSLDPAERVDALRLVELAILSESYDEAAAATAAAIAQMLLNGFPSGELPLDRETARIVAVTQAPEAATRLIDALDRAGDQEQQLHYALALAYVQTGWDRSLRQRLLAWYETTKGWEGGHSLRANVDTIVGASIGRFTPDERRELLDAWHERPYASQLLLRQSRPDQITGYDQAVAQMMLDIDRRSEGNEETLALAIEALGRSGSASSQQTLRRLFDEHPDRREQLARVLALHPDAENWDWLMRSLQFGDSTTLQLCLGALAKIDRVPDKADDFRNVILAGLKLKEQGGLLAASLLEKWTTSPHDAGLDTMAALGYYQAWFSEHHPDAAPAELATADTERTGYTPEQLAELLDQPDVAREADAARGEAVFRKANCIKCHRFLDKGEGVGPDLTALRRRFQRKEIIESLVYPSQVVSDQYKSVTITTVQGQVFTGMPAADPGSQQVVLLLPDATRLTIPRRDIDETEPSKTSVMPEGVLKQLTPQEIADLFAFLETSKNNPLAGAGK